MDNISLSSSSPGIQGYVLENATEMQTRLVNLQRENRRILAVSGLLPDAFLGKSAPFLKVKEMAARVALSDVTVLIQGETGTGKEALAQFIHRESRREGNPFVKVDCSTLPRDLVESELFGHEKGAFTGAVERREGLLEQASGGTLFLDEIGNLSREVQAKLLRFLQDHVITRVGGRKPISIDVRIIAASNVLLSELVKKNEFRQDLYYRMEVVSITLPPLRDRKEDVPELCRHFISHFNARHERKVRDLSPAAYQKLFSYSWPGNVRELRNLVERAVVFCEEELVPAEQIALDTGGSAGGHRGRRGARPLKGMDAEVLKRLFREQDGVAQRVARTLGVSTPALYGKMAKLGLTPHSARR
jgi:transcriptional regulator with PAS, ATPase and Fis domain